MKQTAAGEKGISVIVVPCWWDGSSDRFIFFITLIFLF
jgi:hypothetical protein